MELLKKTFASWMDDNALRLSAALAYYSVFSIAPLLVLSLGIAGWLFGADAQFGKHLEDQLQDLIGPQASQVVQSMIKSSSHPSQSISATVVGMVTLLLGASGVFGQLKDALNTVWGVKVKSGRGWRCILRERMPSFGMVLVIGFLLLVSFLLTTLLNVFSDWVGAKLQLPAFIWASAGMLVSYGIITLLFALLFKVLPDVEIDWRHVWTGALVTALLFELGKFGLALYLGRESTASSFGAAGSVVLLLLWVYYASCILLFGAEFTKVYATEHGVVLRPAECAELVTPEARIQQGLTPRQSVEPAREEPPRETLPFAEAKRQSRA
jgi:membrane protein